MKGNFERLPNVCRHVKEGFLEALDQALDELEQINPPAANVVESRYFGGLSAAETAAALGVSERTAQRYWVYAKAWLLQELQ